MSDSITGQTGRGKARRRMEGSGRAFDENENRARQTPESKVLQHLVERGQAPSEKGQSPLAARPAQIIQQKHGKQKEIQRDEQEE